MTKHLLQGLMLCLPLISCSPAVHRAQDALPPGAGAQTAQLAQVKDQLDGLSQPPATPSGTAVSPLIGRGFSQISGQPGRTPGERRLMAIRAARVEAMRDLTEQIHGVSIDGQTTIRDAVVTDDALSSRVDGVLRGAITRSIRPVGSDGYEVVMQIDHDTVGYIVRMAGGTW